LIKQEELRTLIPHSGKMLLLDRVIDYDIEHSILAEYNITENCIFYDPVLGGVPAWVGFEFIAQTISALTGIRKRARKEKPNIGFILSIPYMRMDIPFFKNGSLAEIRVRESYCTDMIYTFEGEIFLEDKKVMEGKLMVMEVSDEQQKRLIGGAEIN
jgi:predicted hotdog family 3-hydroxylacyl-ACP dehydratase